MEILADIQRWYNAQCDNDWEHDFGLTIKTLDNPGWLVEIDLADTLLEDQPFEPMSVDNARGIWLSCHVAESIFRGAGDPSQLSRILEVFLEWAKTVPDWLATPEWDEAKSQAAQDQFFLSVLGEEIGPDICRSLGCTHKRVAHSVLCRQHHYESIQNKPYPFETT